MKPAVVFLHGLGRTHRAFGALRRAVEAAGYSTWARTYPSRRRSISELASALSAQIREEVGDRPILGVTHSLGGILARHMRYDLDWRGVVMLAPPNRGSYVAAALGKKSWFRRLFGPAALDLGDDGRTWPDPPSPFAVIAGTRGPSLGNPPSWLIRALRLLPADDRHDGTVSLAETTLRGMAGFAEVPASHTHLANHPKTRELVLRFLADKNFGAA